MTNFQFSRAVQVDIQGQYAFNFISLTAKQAEFDLIGFSNPSIKLIEKRPKVCRKIAEILSSGAVEQLAEYINRPAYVKLLINDDGKLVISLGRTRAKKIRHMLWVAIGIGPEIPYYPDYARLQAEPYEKDTFALFYLFCKPKELMDDVPAN